MNTLTPLDQQKHELAHQCQRGITFIIAATVYWLGVGLAGIYLQPKSAFLLSIWMTGILFPLSVLLAKVFKINIFFKNPLTPLGIWANVFQLFFFPVFFISANSNIYFPPVFMGVLAGAHFVFYHWLYRSPAYLIMAFVISLSSYTLGFFYPDQTYAIVGLSNATWLGLGVVLLSVENRRHAILTTA